MQSGDFCLIYLKGNIEIVSLFSPSNIRIWTTMPYCTSMYALNSHHESLLPAGLRGWNRLRPHHQQRPQKIKIQPRPWLLHVGGGEEEEEEGGGEEEERGGGGEEDGG